MHGGRTLTGTPINPRTGKPGIRLRLCTDAAIVEKTMLKRDRDAYKAVARKKWGDAL